MIASNCESVRPDPAGLSTEAAALDLGRQAEVPSRQQQKTPT